MAARDDRRERARESLVRHFPAWLLLIAIFGLIAPNLLVGMVGYTVEAVVSIPGTVANLVSSIGDVFNRPAASSGVIAPLFTLQVKHWAADIERWSKQYDLDPNLLATVMQIESCGHPTVSSHAGAQGLFQVMPFHFASTENQLDPDTNAMRGANFLNSCLDWANHDPGRAMACYNGGPSVLSKPFETWHSEPQRYYRWGMGIYNDARNNSATSSTLDQWLAAGGSSLCNRASQELGLN